MVESDQGNGVTFRRIARRVEDILEEAREREGDGHSLSLEVEARFRLQGQTAVQFQVASVILEETGGLRQEEVVSELLSLGLEAVLNSAARSVAAELSEGGGTSRPVNSLVSHRIPAGSRMLN